MVRKLFYIKENKFINLYILDIQDTTSSSNSLFRSCRTLLMVLYRRDCRRSFAPAGHWLIGDLKTSSFINELKKGRKTYSVLNFIKPNFLKKTETLILLCLDINSRNSSYCFS